MLLQAMKAATLRNVTGPKRFFSSSARFMDAAHKVVVVGGGSAGLSVSHQLLKSGKFAQDEIAIVEPSPYHHYQPGWTLVGAGLKSREELRRNEKSLVDSKIQLYEDAVTSLAPEQNQVVIGSGEKISYDHLIVASGYVITLDGISGLREALQDEKSNVTSIYTYETVDKVFPKIDQLKEGHAIFTQPGSPIKCAGAPQKIMWLALDYWAKQGLYKKHDPSSPIKIDFATGLPVMFGVPTYSQVLNKLREERGVGGLFQHNLVAIEDQGKTAVFARPDGEKVRKTFDFMHVTPTMAPPEFLKKSTIANEAGFANVDNETLRHVKYQNVWSLGDSSSLPTSKTAAAITAQAPVLVSNLLASLDGREPTAKYDGYTSCPLLTEYGKVLLAEFKYEGTLKETFSKFGINQSKPQRAFYYLKKDFFPWIYYNNMVKGTWAGPKGFFSGIRSFSTSARQMRNTPVRHPRDPLDKNAHATRFPLMSGETFISRTPPSQASSRMSVEASDILFESTNETVNADVATMAPQLRQRHRQARGASKILDEKEIMEVQQLRQKDPYTYTSGVLAKQFGCSPTFISIVAPAPKEVRQARLAETELKKATWGMNKRISRAQRQERRALW
ncbi:eukaryotic sulfide quinone oxidoreductase [Malassezia equina]|uniref:Eukaryotic sulfide quinone oxidoreductase n=1 Tax=Malassezia equina TaxID=1381935 RepID=A0AAF0EAL4_9BASI|nr:eukaryotic sulfide quinone oxidoreductase [Malassezia equina]